MFELSPKILVLVVIVIYTRPLWIFRYKFRSIVYREKGWKINFKPWFVKEILALFSNRNFKSKREVKIAWLYRAYLVGFAGLWWLFRTVD